MGALLNTIEMPNGWTVEEHDTAAAVSIRESTAPAGVLARFPAHLHRVPSTRTVRVFYRQGSSVEDRVWALNAAVKATGPNWQRVAMKWWKRRLPSGRYRFYVSIGKPIDVEETFAQLTAQLDTSIQHTMTTNSEATA